MRRICGLERKRCKKGEWSFDGLCHLAKIRGKNVERSSLLAVGEVVVKVEKRITYIATLCTEYV